MTLTQAQMELLEGDFIVKDSLQLRPFVKNMVIEFPPIYYDYDKWDITKSSEYVLNDMTRVLQEHPSILVELGSHTDARGTLEYNDILSQKRAESAVKYILAKGISPQRLTAKGYGERVPKTLDKDTSGFAKGTTLRHTYLDSLEKSNKTMSELGHQLNRRTEFKIVGFIAKAVDTSHIEVIDNGAKEELPDSNLIKNQEQIIKKKFGDSKAELIKQEDVPVQPDVPQQIEIKSKEAEIVDPFGD
jgi:outer membrane protein OmpA-like peptidoglycan-associated protein